jgi:hypothetical protein
MVNKTTEISCACWKTGLSRRAGNRITVGGRLSEQAEIYGVRCTMPKIYHYPDSAWRNDSYERGQQD